MKSKKVVSAVLALSVMSSVCVAGVASAAEKEPSVEWYLPQTVKIGEYVSAPYAMGKNLPVKGYMDEEMGWISDYHGRIMTGNSFDLFGGREYKSMGGGPEFVEQDGTCRVGNLNVAPFAPGTFTYQFEVYECDDSGNEIVVEKVGDPYTVTIEEPVIQTNAPESAAVGSTLVLETALTNTALKNEEVAPYLDPENYYIFTRENGQVSWYPKDLGEIGVSLPAFRPYVEIIEGAELVERADGDYARMLESSEKLTFTGTGTVKLKVKYQQILRHSNIVSDSTEITEFDPEMDFEGSYSPEQIITIQVTEDGKAPGGGTDETTTKPDSDSTAPSETTSGSQNGGSNTSSPDTGDAGFIMPLATLAVSGGAVALLLRRKKNR